MEKATRSYPNEFKQEAVKLALESISVSSVAKELGIPDATLHTWVNKAKKSGKYISSNPDAGDLNIIEHFYNLLTITLVIFLILVYNT